MVKLNVLLSLIKHHSIAVYLFAFLIPLYPKWLGYGILFIVLEQLIKRNFATVSSYKKFFDWKNSGFWLLLFYLMHFVGMTYSENSSFGWMDIGMKSSFAIFPIIFILFRFEIKQSFVFKSLISGAFLGILICFYLSYLNYVESGNTWHFRESYLSHFMHRSYWASYLVLAFIFSVYLVLKRQVNILLGSLLAIVFFAVVFMTGSKAGILILVVSAIALLIYLSKEMKRLKWAIGLGIFATIISISTLSYFPWVTNRIENSFKYATGEYTINVKKTESTIARILMWDTACDLIKENFWLGVGTGDVKDELRKRNYEKGFTGVADKNFNSHNQFLNSHVAIGFFGVLFLILSFLTPVVFSKGKNRFAKIGVVLILFLSLIPEAFLETQAGIIPVAFFLSMLGAQDIKKIS